MRESLQVKSRGSVNRYAVDTFVVQGANIF